MDATIVVIRNASAEEVQKVLSNLVKPVTLSDPQLEQLGSGIRSNTASLQAAIEADRT